jgi:hypothetical protein
MGAPGENLEIPEEVAAQVQENPASIEEFNEGVRESAEIVANVDKGFVRYISSFRNDLPVTAVIRAEKGHQGEYGWGAYFEQGRHRCILAGTVANRPVDEAWDDRLWTACAEWVSFMPRLGQPKIHVERLGTPDEFAHIFEAGTYERTIGGASEYRRAQMARFAHGTQSFQQRYEWQPYAVSEPSKRADHDAYHAAASRRFRIPDGQLLWDQGQGFPSPGVVRRGAGDVPPVRAIRPVSVRGTSIRWTRRGRNRI